MTTRSEHGAGVVDIGEQDWETGVIERSRTVPVVVDFWAPWCGPCRVLGPILERVAGEMDGAWVLAKVNVDENQALAQRYGVRGIPMVIGFRDGKPADTFTGALPESQVRAWLRKLIPSGADQLATEAAGLASTDPVQAIERYRAALTQDEHHAASVLGLGRLLLLQGDPEAATVLGQVQASSPSYKEARSLLALGEFLATPTDVQDDPRYAAAAEHARRSEWEQALEQLLAAIRQPNGNGPKGATDRTRRTMLTIFEVLGNDDPLVVRYRRLLANALF